MNIIGSKISSAASAINPFKGTVNTEKTSNEGLTFHGTELKLDLGSTGNFALRKIYNSIVNAPGHAFNAVKSFTNYLYGNNGDAEKAPLHDAQGAPLPDAQGAPLPDAQGAPLPDAQGAPLHDAQGAPLHDAQAAQEAQEAKLAELKDTLAVKVKGYGQIYARRDLKESSLNRAEQLKNDIESIESQISLLEKAKTSNE